MAIILRTQICLEGQRKNLSGLPSPKRDLKQDPPAKVTGTYDGVRVLDATARLLSRALVSQSTSVACYTFAWEARLLVLHVSIVLMVYCVNMVFVRVDCWYTRTALRKQLVYYNIEGQRRRPEIWCIHSSVTSSVKQTPFFSLPFPFCATCLRSCRSLYRVTVRIWRSVASARQGLELRPISLTVRSDAVCSLSGTLSATFPFSPFLSTPSKCQI
jgi:hypothetical protein